MEQRGTCGTSRKFHRSKRMSLDPQRGGSLLQRTPTNARCSGRFRQRLRDQHRHSLQRSTACLLALHRSGARDFPKRWREHRSLIVCGALEAPGREFLCSSEALLLDNTGSRRCCWSRIARRLRPSPENKALPHYG